MMQRPTSRLLPALAAIVFASGVAAVGAALWPAPAPAPAPIEAQADSSPRSPESGDATPPPSVASATPDAAQSDPPLRPAIFGALAPDAPLSTPWRPTPKPEVLEQAADVAQPSAPQKDQEVVANPDTPLPPRRPPELAGLSTAPLPPPRPPDLDGSTVVVTALAPQTATPAATQAAAAVTPLQELKPALVEPTPPNVENAPFQKGQNAFVRIFKQEGQLELWLKRNGRFGLYKTYPICKWSGHLGPKLREGDYQSPEGFYNVSARQLRPNSNYHRAFNVGFPNALDKQNGYTGGLIMVHGNCLSVGCYAMTDRGIEEIYDFVAAAIGAGQREVPVHIFPFRMTETALARETGTGFLAFASTGNSQWGPFWRNLKEGYDLFEQTGEPPAAYACRGRYAFNGGGSCQRIAGW